MQLYLLCLQAKRKPLCFCNTELNGQLIFVPEPLFGHTKSTSISEKDQLISTLNDLNQTCLPIESFLEFGNFMNQNNTLLTEGSLNQYFVPSSIIERWGSAMGILNIIS